MLILLGGWASLAQTDVVKSIVKGESLSFSAEQNSSVRYHWSIVNGSTGLIEKVLPSRSFQSGDYVFVNPGLYYVDVFPIDKLNLCRGESLRIPIEVLNDQPSMEFVRKPNDYVCSSNNGDSSDLAYFTVRYSGPKPWSFKLSIDGDAAEEIHGADEIWTDTFTFPKAFYNNSSRQKSFEIQLVEMYNKIGVPIKKDVENQISKIDVLPSPQTKFYDLNTYAHIGETRSYSALIENDGSYEIFLPKDAVVNNETINDTEHRYLKLLSFDVKWGNSVGIKQIKLLENNVYECAGDTIYANINIVDDVFVVDLGKEVSLCQGEEYIIKPKTNVKNTYSYLWNTGERTETITVSNTGKYSVDISDGINTVSDFINVNFNNLPIVNLGEDIILKEGDDIVLQSQESCDVCNYEWSTDATTPSIIVNTAGNYSLSVEDSNKCLNSDDINVKIGPRFNVDLGPDREICGELRLSPTIDKSIDPEFLWLPGGDQKFILVTESGKYCVNITDKITGDIESDCVDIIVKTAPIVELGRDRVLLSGEFLDAGIASDWTSYEWFFKDTFTKEKIPEEVGLGIDQVQMVTKSGVYFVDVINQEGCVCRDEVQITISEEAILNVPTAFSPNGDGINDAFAVKGKLPLGANYNIVIYNRLGHKVFSSNNISTVWNGKTNGVSQDLDVYVYFIEIEYANGETIHQKGNLTLVY